MKVAVMQPYLFPYLGYYQLVNCVDTFVLYDDVTFIKQGWINRNNILLNGQAHRLTVPVPGASPNINIKDLAFSPNVSKCLKTIRQAYAKAPYFEAIYPIVERVLASPERDITSVCAHAIAEVMAYIGKERTILRSSDLTYNRDLPAADRLIDMCNTLGSSDYVNSPGGQKLYSKEYFSQAGCALSFIQMNRVEYSQGRAEFVPNLSMIDVLMWCDKQQTRNLLDQYELV